MEDGAIMSESDVKTYRNKGVVDGEIGVMICGVEVANSCVIGRQGCRWSE
jgi:hypothetical protein